VNSWLMIVFAVADSAVSLEEFLCQFSDDSAVANVTLMQTQVQIVRNNFNHTVRPRIVHPPVLVDRSAFKRMSLKGSRIDYSHDGQTYSGYLVTPNHTETAIPAAGVLIAPTMKGISEYEMARADQMASRGYTAFVLDPYGKDVCPPDGCAQTEMGELLENLAELRNRISAGTQELLKHTPWDSKLVAIGYCFGGWMVLDLAKHPDQGSSAGVTFAAVSSLHGLLEPVKDPVEEGEIVTNVQVHHAELDMQGDAALQELRSELSIGVNGTSAAWEAIVYSGVGHGWTNPSSLVYDERASIAAHLSTFQFLDAAAGIVHNSDILLPSAF